MHKFFAPVSTLLLCVAVSAPLMAQTPATTQNLVDPEKPVSNVVSNVEKPDTGLGLSSLASDFISDQKAIWTSPLHMSRGDVAWLAPIGAGGILLYHYDQRISDAAKADTSLRSPANALSMVGEFAPYAIPGTMYVMGAVTHNPHTLEAGRLGVEAELDSEVVMNVIKFTVGRTRPNGADNMSFPSGHAMSSFAMAAVLSREYPDKPLIKYGSYGFATAVSLA